MGFDVTLIDAREWFLTEERFPHVARRILAWPDKGMAELVLDAETYLVILSHDPKFERPALKYALQFPLRYIGAIGSRKTHADRLATLRAEGVSDADLARIHAPIGLDIGAVSPEEIAISILAEMIAAREGKSGGMMSAPANPPRRRRSRRNAKECGDDGYGRLDGRSSESGKTGKRCGRAQRYARRSPTRAVRAAPR